jgi:hypothetical protein
MKIQRLGLSKLQWFLVGALALQVILAVVLNLPQRTQPSSGPLLEGYDPAKIIEILIENESGDQLHLQKAEGQWAIPEKGNFPVKFETVTDMLDGVKSIQTNRMVTKTAASHSQLKVADDEFVSKIILKEGGGKTYRLFLGSSGGAGATHVRLSGQNQVYLTADLSSWEVSPALSSWIETNYVTLVQDQIHSITVQNSFGIFIFTKGEDGEWIYENLVEGEEFDIESFKTTVNRLISLRMVEPLGTVANPVWGLDEPGAVAIFELQDDTGSSSQFTLSIGAILGGNFAAKASSSPYYVKIAPVYANSLLDMEHESLLVVEPTPTPTITP